MMQVLSETGYRVLVVDDEAAVRRIVRVLLSRENLEILEAQDTREAEEILARHNPEVMLLDIGLPGESGLDFLERIHPQYPDTTVLMTTGVDDATVASHAMQLGAVDYIVKPYSHGTFLASLANAIQKRELLVENRQYRESLELKVAERTRQVQEAQDATVFAMAKIAQSRDDETGLHLERMRDYSVSLARCLQREGYPGVDDAFIISLYRSSPLHDIGKVGIPDAVLLKKGKLTPEEFALMKSHSVIGAQCLEGAAGLATSEVGSFLRMGRDVARAHHEAWDGGGYPDGLAGDAIPLSARIVSLADFYDALAFPRVYRPVAFPHEKIREMIMELDGKKFDPDIVQTFLDVEEEFLTIRQNRTDAEDSNDDHSQVL